MTDEERRFLDRMSGKPDWRHGLIWLGLCLAWLVWWFLIR